MRKSEVLSELQKARERIGAGPHNGAKWLLEFCRIDLDALSAGGLIDLGWEAFPACFTGEGDLELIAPQVSGPRSKDDLAILQKQIGAMVGRLMSGDSRDFDFTIRCTLSLKDGKPNFQWRVGPDSMRPKHQILVTLQKAANQFQVCPECGHPFIAARNQVFCSQQCAQRKRSRNFREKNPERVKEIQREAWIRKTVKDGNAKEKSIGA